MEMAIAGCVCAALLIAPLTIKTEAENEPASPCAGVGRIARIEEETTNYTPETETAENEPYIAPEEDEMIAFTLTGDGKIKDVEFLDDIPDAIPEPDPIIETDIDALIVQVAAEYGLPWELVRAVCYVESGFDPYARSDHPDYGLMQVWSEVWRSYGYNPNDSIVYDPETNLRMGCTILKTALDNSDGDMTKALMRYNRGDAYAMNQWSQGIFSTAYTEKVLGKYYEYLRGEY